MILSLLFCTAMATAQTGTWSSEGPAANFAATCSAGPAICIAATNDGKIYKNDFGSGPDWQLCVTLPAGCGIVKSITSGDYADCPVWVTTSEGYIYRVNHCNCTFIVESILPAVQGGVTDITWTSGSTAYVSCGNGVVYKTTNEGNTWDLQQTGVTTYLTSIYGEYGTGNVYAVGDMGTVIFTNNGGESWSHPDPGAPVFLSALNPIGDNLFLISGSEGFLTQWDGQTTFTPYTTGTTNGFNGFDGTFWSGSPYAGINVGDNGSYSFLNPDLSLSDPFSVPGVTDYLKSVATNVIPGGKAPDTLMAIVAGDLGLYRYKEPFIPSSINPINTANFRVFPNPVSDLLYLNLPENLTNPTLALYNQLGRNMLEITEPLPANINLRAYPAGFYTLRLTAKEGAFTTKIIKQ